MIAPQQAEQTTQKQKRFPFRVSHRRYLYFIGGFTLLGVGAGLAYYLLVGCRSGGCAITSSPYLSMIWGGLAGYLVTDIFVKKVPTS